MTYTLPIQRGHYVESFDNRYGFIVACGPKVTTIRWECGRVERFRSRDAYKHMTYAADVLAAKARCEHARGIAEIPQPKSTFKDELDACIAIMRQRAIRAHQICNLLRIAHPEIGELSDDGCLHEAIHDILRVEVPTESAA